ncbi:MAG: aminotransferase class V-fold PLP-dependent enzyme [Planctomycetes bacterium]|nr:aminotransferase class V-fold PLP-dependent enzyme [Planctomycetota bacterium]
MALAAETHEPERWRALFPIVEDTNYLVNHSLGAMPARARDKLAEFLDQWATRGVRAWGEGWWDVPVTAGNVLGRLLNAPADSVVMHQNVSVVQALIASALDFTGRRNKVVYTDQNFPTVMYVWEGYKKLGARIQVVPTDGITVDTARLLEAIDEETLVVPISHVTYKSHFLQDAAAIQRRAREVGALVVLDTYQSLGTVPVDVQDLDVDFVCGGSVKWLCGGPGAGYLYVRPELLPTLEPRITGWAAHAAPFAFEPGAQRYATGIRRMLHGSPSVATFWCATAGYETLLECGVENVRRWSQRLTERLRRGLLTAGFRIHGPEDPARRGGTITVGLAEDENGPAFVKALEARGILVDHRPAAGIRVSPHFYTLEEELDEFVEVLVELREKRAWRNFVSARTSY